MAEFKPAIAATLKNEGYPGYNIDNNKAEVCAGINRKFWPEWAGWMIIDQLKAQGLDRNAINTELSKDSRLRPLVESFYQRNFWTPSIQKIVSQSVANWIFDKGVQTGIGQATRLIQRAAGVPDDGKFGPNTLNAINSADPQKLLDAAHDQAVAFYQELHQKDPVKYPAGMVSRA